MISDYIKETLKNIKRNKKCLFFMIINTLLIVVLSINIIFIFNFNNFFENFVGKNIGFRSIIAYNATETANNAIDDVKKIDYVDEAYESRLMSFSAQSNFNYNGFDGNIDLLYGTENIVLNSVIGKSMNELKNGEMICPYYFFPDSSVYSISVDKSKLLNPDDLLNLDLEIKYYSHILKDNQIISDGLKSRNFRIVGLYDSTLNMNFNNQCYITANDMEELHNALNPQLANNDVEGASLLIVVDNVLNLDSVINDLVNLGYEDFTIANEIDSNSINKVKFLAYSVVAIVSLTIIFVFSNFIIKEYKNESKNIGMLKAFGYTNVEIITKYMVNNFVLLFIVFALSFLLLYLIFVIVKSQILSLFSLIGFDLDFRFINIILSLSCIFCLEVFVSYLCMKQFIKKEIQSLLLEESL